MIKAEQIPDEVVEAAARAYAVANDTPELWWRLYEEKSRAACRAMLKAWPGMHIHEWQRPWLGGMSGTDIILPLTEHTND